MRALLISNTARASFETEHRARIRTNTTDTDIKQKVPLNFNGK